MAHVDVDRDASPAPAGTRADRRQERRERIGEALENVDVDGNQTSVDVD